MATITFNITFNEDNINICLNGLTTNPIVKTVKAESWKSLHYIEYAIDKYCKWIFNIFDDQNLPLPPVSVSPLICCH